MCAELGTLKRLSHKTTPALPADVRKALGFPENAAIYSGSARYRGEAPTQEQAQRKANSASRTSGGRAAEGKLAAKGIKNRCGLPISRKAAIIARGNR